MLDMVHRSRAAHGSRHQARKVRHIVIPCKKLCVRHPPLVRGLGIMAQLAGACIFAGVVFLSMPSLPRLRHQELRVSSDVASACSSSSFGFQTHAVRESVDVESLWLRS